MTGATAPGGPPARPAGRPPRRLGLQWVGVGLFAFIPLVLFLFVVHPEPIALSLVAGVALMVGHRRLARPYMERSVAVKCLWCNRALPETGGAAAATARQAVEERELVAGGGRWTARFHPGHAEPVERYFAFLDRFRWPLRAGIFLPLLALLAALAAAAAGLPAPLPAVTAGFKLAIGVTVNAAAFGYLATPPRTTLAVPFPVHNFYLLGVRALLWIFRLVGIWWIAVGVRYLLG